MKQKMIAASLALVVAASYIGIVAVHGFDITENQNIEFNKHHEETLELRNQYYNGDITAKEFYEEMENNDFHEEFEEYMPCHGGYAMTGFSSFGMMV